MPGYLFVYSTKDSDAMMQPVTDTAVEVLDYFARTKVRRAFFSERVTSDWNSLPDTVVGAATVDGFKAALNAHWRNLDSMYNPDCLH